MTIHAKIILDSVSEAGVRLTTMQLCYPRFIHSEFMTHRVFSRNAASSRAIPVAKMIEQVRTNPAMPIHWGKNQPGMQAREELYDKATMKSLWKYAASDATHIAELMEKEGAHKQIVNRILEPFQWMHTIVTATEWDNFFALRLHRDAQPEIQQLAMVMQAAMLKSKPTLCMNKVAEAFNWHLPYISMKEFDEHQFEPAYLAKLSTARCARVSYLTHDGKNPEPAKDVKLHDDLVGSVPIHASPTEHIGYPLDDGNEWNKNYRGWYQYRSLVEENLK